MNIKKRIKNKVGKQLLNGVITVVNGDNTYDVLVPGRDYPYRGVPYTGPEKFDVDDVVYLGFIDANGQLPFIIGYSPHGSIASTKIIYKDWVPHPFVYQGVGYPGANQGLTGWLEGADISNVMQGTGQIAQSFPADDSPGPSDEGYLYSKKAVWRLHSSGMTKIQSVSCDVVDDLDHLSLSCVYFIHNQIGYWSAFHAGDNKTYFRKYAFFSDSLDDYWKAGNVGYSVSNLISRTEYNQEDLAGVIYLSEMTAYDWVDAVKYHFQLKADPAVGLKEIFDDSSLAAVSLNSVTIQNEDIDPAQVFPKKYAKDGGGLIHVKTIIPVAAHDTFLIGGFWGNDYFWRWIDGSDFYWGFGTEPNLQYHTTERESWFCATANVSNQDHMIQPLQSAGGGTFTWKIRDRQNKLVHEGSINLGATVTSATIRYITDDDLIYINCTTGVRGIDAMKDREIFRYDSPFGFFYGGFAILGGNVIRGE